jgi:ubiquinone/menaquinone biosynthesis C-methylase UbiE
MHGRYCATIFFKKYTKGFFCVGYWAGYCEFINNIQCARKIAVDTNQDTTRFASEEVTVINCLSTDLSCFSNGSIDIVFMSNFLEHLGSKDDIIRTLLEVYRILKAGGSVMILQPNIRYVYKEYWDFFDHCTPLSDKSLVEVLQTVGFIIQEILPKFLPYTTKVEYRKARY